MRRSFEFPIIAVTIFLTGVAMFGPAAVALAADDHPGSRVFFYTGLLIIVFSVIAGIAIHNVRQDISHIDQLFGLLLAFALLPALLAVPVAALYDNVPFLDLYVDMVSCLTTTGAAIVELQPRQGLSIEVWRAEAAWLGGYIMWVAAAAILEPLAVGGFEVNEWEQKNLVGDTGNEERRVRQQLSRHSLNLFPWYFGATTVLCMLEMIAGEDLLQALVLAMSTISTSGILLNAETGLLAEAFVLAFLVLAWSSLFVTGRKSAFRAGRFFNDPELKTAFIVLAGAVAVVVALNSGAFVVAREANSAAEAAAMIWASIYTSASFLATAGFESSVFEKGGTFAQYRFPEFMLIMLAVCGGGVATTAGGVKLLRVLALARLSNKELSRLVYPSTVMASSGIGRGLRVTGQEFAWIAFILFFISISLYLLAFAATGLSFKEATVVSIAALSTTGPLSQAVMGPGFGYDELGNAAKCLMASAMILGRLEFLTVIALFNPALWRR